MRAQDMFLDAVFCVTLERTIRSGALILIVEAMLLRQMRANPYASVEYCLRADIAFPFVECLFVRLRSVHRFGT